MARGNLEIMVLLREVYDPRPPAQIAPGGMMIRERGLRRIVNPADLEALETALELQDRGLANVTTVAVGPERMEDTLRMSLAMGAKRAIRVWDYAFEVEHVLSDACLYAQLLKILQPSAAFTGARLLDRGDEPSLALAAAELGMCYCPAVVDLDLGGETITVVKKANRGGREKLSLAMPCVLLFEEGFRMPRYAGLDSILASLEAQPEIWGLPELGLSTGQTGDKAGALQVMSYGFPRPSPMRVPTPAADLPAFERIMALLSGGIRLREGKMHVGNAEETAEGLLAIFRREGLV
jgi:electron transfer flavoprotein beta subunit